MPFSTIVLVERAVIIWADSQGEQTLNIYVTSTGVSAIRTNLAALSNAVPVESSEGTRVAISGTPTVATYPSVRSNARLYFRAASGSRGTLLIPAPISSIFLSDGVTIDPSAVSSLVTAALGNLVCGDSTLAAVFDGGELVQTKFSGISSAPLFTP